MAENVAVPHVGRSSPGGF